MPGLFTIAAFGAAEAGSIRGRVFEDVNYGGGRGANYANASGIGLNGVRVEIYEDGTFVTSTTTAGTGANTGTYGFTFSGDNHQYVIRVVSGTVRSTRAVNSGQTLSNAVAVPTFHVITGANESKSDDLNYVGGQNPARVDAGNGSSGTTLASLSTATTVAQVQTSFTDADNNDDYTGIDFGFNFNTIVNTNDSGQGSLRQFIINSNTLSNTSLDQRANSGNGAGGGGVANAYSYNPASEVETAIFMIPNGEDQPGINGGTGTRTLPARQLTGDASAGLDRAFIVLASALPAITDPVSLDATTQSKNVRRGGSDANTSTDTNAGQLGTGGFVGTDNVTLLQVNRPEVELAFPTGVTGLTFSANNSSLIGVSARGGAVTVLANNNIVSFSVRECILGTAGTSLENPNNAGYGTSNLTLQLLNFTGTIQNNIIAYSGSSGINYSGGAGTAGYTIKQNEFLQNGWLTAGGDNITIGDNGAAGPVLIEENLIREANSSGIQFEIGQVSNNIVRNNTIINNGKGGTASRLEGSGIHYLQRNGSRLSANTDLIEKNIITTNQSSGVVINWGQRNVRITRNSIFGNGDGTTGGVGLLAVDFTPAGYQVGCNCPYGQGDGVTPNDGLLDANASNGGLDYPVITRKFVTTSGANTQLRVTGYVGRNFGQAAFAGVTVELYKGDNATDNNQNGPIIAGDGQSIPHGEPKQYLGSFVTGADGTFDATITFATNSVSPALTITDPINSVAYRADLGTSEAGINLIPNTLPVELVAFDVKASGQTAQLSWRTAQEKNNDHFVVERSLDGRTFAAVGKVQGQGTKTSATNYRFENAYAGRGLVYYRLKQVDTDGTSTYSDIRTVQFGSAAVATAPSVFPNPVDQQPATLDLSGLAATEYLLTLSNAHGKVVYQAQVLGGQRHPLPTAALAGGAYFARLTGPDATLTIPLIKK
ncbi:hypothetical protein GCM10027048_33560 [Hymenobacter coalescens]